MSIVSELQRFKSEKDQIIDLLDYRGFTTSNSIKTSDMPAMMTGVLHMETPIYENLQTGYVSFSGSAFGSPASWIYEQPNGSMSDVYKLKANHMYFGCLGIPGTRFRAMICDRNPVGSTGTLSGTGIIAVNDPPVAKTWVTDQTDSRFYIAPSDCFLIIQKDNAFNATIKTYLLDMTYLENPPSVTWETDLSIRPVGGKIFYIDPNSDRQVKFYDSSKQEIQNVAIGDTPAYYEVLDEGTNGKDKYYVYDNTTGIVNRCWGYGNIPITGASYLVFGKGRQNTETILAIEDTSEYWYNSIWRYLTNTQNFGLGVNRCDDWYVGCTEEILKLYDSGLEPTWFESDDLLWSSSTNGTLGAWIIDYDYSEHHIRGWGRETSSGHPVCFIRSF